MLPEFLHLPLTYGVLAVIVLALTVFRGPPDGVLLGGLVLLLVAGVIDVETALAGFVNEGLVAVAVLFVVAEGLQKTGGLDFAANALIGPPKRFALAQARVCTSTAALSAFLNNTPVVAMMMPLIGDWCRKHRIDVGHMLMPLSFATILGGLCTLIGTSTTLVVNGLLLEYEAAANVGNGGLELFELAWVGLPAAVLGIAYLVLFSRRLLPIRKPAIARSDDPREYTVEMLVDPGSQLVGKTIEAAGLRHLPEMYLSEIEREDEVIPAVPPNERLQAGDRLVFVGVIDSILDLRRIPGLKPATNQTFKLDIPSDSRILVEAVVSNTCPCVRMTVREARFRNRYNAVIIAVARNGQRVRRKIGDIVLLPGDTLLLEAPPGFHALQRNSRDFFLVSQIPDSAAPRHERAWIARGLMLALVASVTFGLLSMVEAALLTAGLMVMTRCIRVSEARRSVDWSVLIAMGAGLGLGKALETTGGARLIADAMIGSTGENSLAVLAVVYLLTMVFTNLITAKAAAVLFFPIAMAAAEGLGASHRPFAVAVMIASAATFATPIGYQTNLMVYGPGGYRFTDFLRLGGPLSLIVAAVTLWIAPLVWPL